MASIKDAIVRTLEANPLVRDWATGGVFQQRAPGKPTDDADRSRRKNYIVVRVEESDPDESHTQDSYATVCNDTIVCRVWANRDKDAQEGANRVRWALDATAGEEADIEIIRLFWRGTVDGNAEDLSAAEQLMYGAFATFGCHYRLPRPPE